jgi:hypothetical protein
VLHEGSTPFLTGKSLRKLKTVFSIMKHIPYKKLTFEDKFDRKYACWVENNPAAWKYWKRRNRKSLRRILKKGILD